MPPIFLLAVKIAFLVILYLFVARAVRATRGIRGLSDFMCVCSMEQEGMECTVFAARLHHASLCLNPNGGLIVRVTLA